MEDLLRIFRLLLNTDGPIDFDGKIWKYRQAWIGEAKANQPKVYSMGGGERLINLAAECADGFVSITPFAFHTPEEYAVEVDKVKLALDKAGRDPEEFTFGLWHNVLLFDKSEERDALLDNPYSASLLPSSADLSSLIGSLKDSSRCFQKTGTMPSSCCRWRCPDRRPIES